MLFNFHRGNQYENGMFWNLLANKYEEYKLSHLALTVVLVVYSIVGALIFCTFEAPHEIAEQKAAQANAIKTSNVAKDRLAHDLQYFFKNDVNITRLLQKDFIQTLEKYDQLMGFEVNKDENVDVAKRWTLWGGLYYAGTIYTTIGYGDLAAVTVGGRIATMIYAMFGIPLVITVLNDWGTLLFQGFEFLWKNQILRMVRFVKRKLKFLSRKAAHMPLENHEDAKEHLLEGGFQGNPQEPEGLPLKLAVGLLLGFVLSGAGIFCFVEEWTYFESLYFFVISLTTIGLGDIVLQHHIAVINFFFILVGLAIFSMSINVIQMQLEVIFARIITSIDNEYKKSLANEKRRLSMGSQADQSTSTNNSPKHSISMGKNVQMLIGEAEAKPHDTDVVKDFAKSGTIADKLLLKFMSHHQKKMLNDKAEDRAKMRNRGTQTEVTKVTICVQTDQVKRLDELQKLQEEWAEEEEQQTIAATKKGPTYKKLYIYNTGD
ncbi:hypothetical protein L596_022451 [Steinernema carpocapsae]|uniref:Potassium channel domain-containing protein n=1 Tax=Steinernema carpocapsae TaxID=34508 RepID=A0A4U5MLP7_STECR|nr:hypothetical protein L596_022451 [Steinernema carpocapsae]